MNELHELESKMNEYQTFVENVLRPQLFQAQSAYESTLQEVTEYQDLYKQMNTFQNDGIPETMQVNLGHEKVFCEARPQPSSGDKEETTVFVHVGMGFHVEFTILQALNYVVKRIDFLQKKSEWKQLKVDEIQQHVTSAQTILDQLRDELIARGQG